MRNDDFLTPPRILLPGEKVKGTEIISNIDFDFTERIYKVHFYGIMDMLSQIGGLRASLLPILGFFAPLFTAHFLYSLAGIIQDKVAQNRYNEMLKLIDLAKKQFLLI